jgi:hypothetical protein
VKIEKIIILGRLSLQVSAFQSATICSTYMHGTGGGCFFRVAMLFEVFYSLFQADTAPASGVTSLRVGLAVFSNANTKHTVEMVKPLKG